MSKRKKSSRKPQRKQVRQHRIDLAIRAVLSLTYAFAAGLYFKNAFAQLHDVDWAHINAHFVGRGLSILAIGLYMLMIACLYILRLKPINTASGAFPCAAAILGSYLLSGLLLLNPQPNLPLAIRIAACFLVVIGNAFSIAILLRLGRSFSILPESRKLVTTGPYKVVRHPLYLAEAVTTLGVLINFLSPWAFILVGAQVALQLARIHYEEHVLRETFPEYKHYAKRTARLIPGIY